MSADDDNEKKPEYAHILTQCDLSVLIFSLVYQNHSKAKTFVVHWSSFNCTKHEFI